MAKPIPRYLPDARLASALFRAIQAAFSKWGRLAMPLWLWSDGTISPAMGVDNTFPHGTPGLFRDIHLLIPQGTAIWWESPDRESK